LSWILGGISKKENLKKIKLPFSPTIALEKKKIAIFCEGQSLLNFEDQNGFINIVSGTGLDEELNLLNEYDWKNIINKKKDLSNLNGHFLLITENQAGLEFFNDQLGLRKLFFYETDDDVFFSTRLDWIVSFISSPKFNFKYLCSLWSFENPLVYQTLIENVKILGPGGYAKITNNKLLITNNPWLPTKKNANLNQVGFLVSKLLNTLILQKGKINLGLSGGIDSRSILALLLKQEKGNWETHTFGQKSIFDVKIANSIARTYKFNHVNHDYPLFSSDDDFGTWKDYVAETNCSLPANTYHELSYYKILPKNEFFIDGGKGEYLRRGLSNRLAILGKQALFDSNINKISYYLKLSKPMIFNDDVIKDWQRNQNEDISNLLNNMPDVSEFGIDNWVDLYNIRYRTGNSGYITQTRLDQIVQNIMPLIQPMILSEVFNLPIESRTKEKINNKLLNLSKRLRFFPLARYDTIIPFQNNKYTSLIWGKFMRLLIKDSSNQIDFFINLNKDYLLTRINDIDFLNNELYDKQRIKIIISDYFAGKNNETSFIIWWMTFDIWSQILLKRRNLY
jgi:hypothetical protein